jgi:hypothetical protein
MLKGSFHYFSHYFSTMVSEVDEQVIKAVKLFRLAPAAGATFSYVDVLVHVGVEHNFAMTETYQVRFNFQSESILQ